MYKICSSQLLKDFSKAIAFPVAMTDKQKWPIKSSIVMSSLRPIFAEEFFTQLVKANVLLEPSNWISSFETPTQIWRLSHHLITGLLDLGIAKQEIAQRILLILEGISILSNNNYFSVQGDHLNLALDNAAAMASSYYNNHEVEADKVLKLAGLLWAFSEANFFVAHELSCEYHGIYNVMDDVRIIIRNYRNLTPTDLWPTRDYSEIPAKIDIITFHDASIKVKFDVYNNFFDNEGTFSTSMTHGVVLVNDKIIGNEELIVLTGVLYRLIIAGVTEVSGLNKHELSHKYIDVFWYRKKSLCDYLGISWQPSLDIKRKLDEVLDSSSNINGSDVRNKSSEELLQLLQERYDFSKYA